MLVWSSVYAGKPFCRRGPVDIHENLDLKRQVLIDELNRLKDQYADYADTKFDGTNASSAYIAQTLCMSIYEIERELAALE